MTNILFTALQTWTATQGNRLIQDGFTVILGEEEKTADGVSRILLELENRKYLGILTLKETGNVQLNCAEKATARIQRGECDVFTEGQLEDAVGQLLEWMGETVERSLVEKRELICPERKVSYGSRAQAKSYIKRENLHSVLEEYRCKYCGQWHLSGIRGQTSVKRRAYTKKAKWVRGRKRRN